MYKRQKYHNVTPPEFYRNYPEFYYSACLKGVEATERLAKMRVDRVWGDSQFNSEEFVRLGVPADRCRVVPPLHDTEDLGRTPLDAVVTGTYRDTALNILFVGAFRPNKGHFKAIETFAAYRELSERPARLFFVGSFDPRLADYVEEVKQYARMLEAVSYTHLDVYKRQVERDIARAVLHPIVILGASLRGSNDVRIV